MNREEDLKNLWKELRNLSDVKEEAKEEPSEEESPKETVELDALLSRLEDVVSRLEDALGKKEDEANKEEGEEDSKKEAYAPRRVRRSLRSR